MRRLLVVLSALLALTFTIPHAAVAQESTPTSGMPTSTSTWTDIHYLAPFTPDGLNPGLTVSSEEEGTCGFGSSAALGRPDAWDCIGEDDQVFDPCFENPYLVPEKPAEVACFDTPFTGEVVLLTLTAPLVHEKEAMADGGQDQTATSDDETSIEPWDLPWALELANGERCTLLHGTLTVVAGQTVNYGCTDGGMILGETDRSQPVWTVHYLADGAFVSSLVEVAAAWS